MSEGSESSATPPPAHGGGRSALFETMLRLVLVALLVVAVAEAQAAATYRVSGGSVTFRLEPAWPGGRLVMPLGPAGEFSLHTHRLPVDIVMAYRLPAETAALTADGGVVARLPALQRNAWAAFGRYLGGRVPWLLLAGAAAGALSAGSWNRRRRFAWGAAAGVVAMVAVGAAVTAVTYATIDRSPAVEYRGLARNLPRVLPLVRALGAGGGSSDRLRGLQEFIDGLEAVALQLTMTSQLPERAKVARLLLVSDVHDNVFGMRVAARLAAGDGTRVDGVLVAGDVTDYGRREEALLFLRAFSSAGAPVVFVGGNHEDRPAMNAFKRAGYHVLDGDLAEVAGVEVLGVGDPLATSPRIATDRTLLTTASGQLATLWQELDSAPQVLLVHDVGQAEGVIATAKAEGEAVVVAFGNDHVAGIHRYGSVTLVDAGTAGASGYQAVGADPPGAGGRDAYAFQLLDFSRESPPRLLGVTTLSFARDGRTVVEYTPPAD